MRFLWRLWNWILSHIERPEPLPEFDHAARLNLRRLEDRQVLSVSAGFVHGALSVGLDGASSTQPQHIDGTNNISITVDSLTHNVLVNHQTIGVGGGATLHASDVTSITIQDNITGLHTIDLSGVTAASGFTQAGGINVQISTGSGSDTVLGSGFADMINVGSGNVTLHGGGGSDLLVFSSSVGTDSVSNNGGTIAMDLTAASSNVAVDLQTHNVLVGAGSIDFIASELTSVLGNASNANSFQGLDLAGTWNINSSNSNYSATGESVTFAGFQTIQGGAGGDSFHLNASNTLNVHGGQGTDHFSLGNNVSAGDLFGGSGTNTLSAGAGTFTLAGGTFTLESSSALSSSSNLILETAGELDLNGFNATVGSLNGTGTITDGSLNASILVVTGGGAFGGSLIDGAGRLALTVDGTNTTLVLSGANSDTGPTTVHAGTLELDGSVTSNITINAGAFLQGQGTVTGNVQNHGTITPGDPIGILTITGNLTSSGTVRFVVNSGWTAAGTDYGQLAVGGTLDLSGSTLTFSNTQDTAAPNLNQLLTLIQHTSSTTTITSSSTNLSDGAAVTIGSHSFEIFFNGGDGNDVVLVDASAPSVVYASPSWSTLTPGTLISDADFGTPGNQPAIYGVNAFATVSAGLSVLTSNGQEIVNSGTFHESVNLQHPQTVTITGNAVVTLDALTAIAGSSVQIQGTSLAIGNAASTTVAAVISGSGELIKQGTGKLTLSGLDSYTGGTQVDAGTLKLGSSQALGSASGGVTVLSGAVLDLNGQSVQSNLVTIGGTGIGGTGALINSNGTATLVGSIILASDTTFGGSGNLTLIGSVDGATINADSLNLTGSGAKTFGGIIGGNAELRGLSQTNGSGTVEFDQTVNLGVGGTTLDANVILGGIQFLSIGSVTFGTASTDTLTITTQSTAIKTTNGSIVLNSTTNAQQSLSVAARGLTTLLSVNGEITDAGSIALTSSDGLAINANVMTTSAGRIDVTGINSINVSSTGAIHSQNQLITLTSDRMILNGSVNAGTGTILVQQFTAGTRINLGGADDHSTSPWTLGLSTSDLSQISAGRLEIGNSSTGIVFVSSHVDLTAAAPVVHLTSGSTVAETSGGLMAKDLAITAVGDVNFTNPSTDVVTLAVESTTGAIHFTNSGPLTIGSIDGVHGVTADSGSVSFTVLSGDLTVAGPVSAGSGLTASIVGANDRFAIQSGGSVTATSGGISLTADNVSFDGSLTAHNQLVTIVQHTNGQLINLGAASSAGTLGLTNADLHQMIAATFRLGNQQSGAVTISSNVSLPGVSTLHVTTGAGVTGTAGGIAVSQLAINAVNTVDLTNTNSNIGTIAINSSSGSIVYENLDDLIVSQVDQVNGISAISGSVSVAVQNGSLTIGNSPASSDVSALTGIGVVLNGINRGLTLNSGANISTSSGGISVTADKMSLQGTITATGQTVTLEQATNGRQINLGTSPSSGFLGLANSDLNAITADLLRIGNQQGGAITVSANIGLTNVNTLHLTTGSNVSETSGSVVVHQLAISTAGNVNMASAGNNVQTLAIDPTDGSISFVNSGNLDIGTVDGIVGVTSAANSIHLTELNGNLTVSSNVTGVTGVTLAVTTSNDKLTVDSGSVVSTSTGGISITADDVILNGNLTAIGQTVSIAQATNGLLIDLGTTSSAATLGLTNATLDQVTANVLRIGNLHTGNLTVSGLISPSNASVLHLISGSNVSETTGAIAVNQLAVTAGGSVHLTSSGNQIGTIGIASGGMITASQLSDLNVGSVDSVSGISTTAGSVDLTISSGNLTVLNTTASSDISATAGITLLIAGANDGFNVNSGANVSTTAGGISISADNINLAGSLSAAGQLVTIVQQTNGRLINLGNNSTPGTLGLTTAELNEITADTLRLGNQQSGAVTISSNVSVSSVNSLHLTTGDSVNGIAGGITVNQMAISAANNVRLTNTNTSIGTLAINSISGSVEFTNSGNLIVGQVDQVDGISATSGSVTVTVANGALTIANTPATGDLTAMSGINITLDGANELFTVNPGANLTTASGGISITADQVSLLGTVTATGQTVTVDQTTHGQLITLGAASSNGVLGLTNAALNEISADLLLIGNQQSGAIIITSNVGLTNVGTVHLTTGSNVTATSGGIAVNQLAISASGTVNVTNTNTDIETVAISSTGGSISFSDTGNLAVGTVDGVIGVRTVAGAISLTDNNGNLTVGADVSATSGIGMTVTSTNDSFTLNAGASVETTSHGILILADNVTVNGTLSAPGQTVTIAPETNGRLINLGSIGFPGSLGLTNTELNQITANVLRIGNLQSGAITISSSLDPVNADVLHLTTGSNVTTSAGGIVIDQLAITSASSVLLTGVDNHITTLAISSTGGNITVVQQNSLIVGAVDGVNGTSTGSGSVALKIQNGNLTIAATPASSDLSATTGVTIAIAGPNDSFNINAGANVTTTSGGISIAADNVNLAGSLTATGQLVTIAQQTNGQLIDLGAGSSTGTLGLTNAQLNEITANILKLGNQQSGAVTVSSDVNIASVNSLHLTTGAGVTGSAGAIITNQLAVSAVNDIDLTNARTTIGTIAINSTAGSVVLENLGNLIVGQVDQVNGISANSGSANVTVQNGSLTIGNTPAAVDVSAMSGINLMVEGVNRGLNLNSGASIASFSGDISITADKMSLLGTVTAVGRTVTLDQSTNGRQINLGTSAPTGFLGLMNSDLNEITANLLQIGNQQTGAITVSANIGLTNVNTLHVTTGSSVAETSGGISVDHLAVSVAGNVSMTNISNNVGTVAVNSTTGSINFVNSSNLDIGTVDGVVGVTSSTSSISLTDLNGNLTISNDLTASTGITLAVPGANHRLIIDPGSVVSTSAGGISVTADNMTIHGSLTASGQTISISQSTIGQMIDLGSASSAGTLGLTNAELNQVSASRLMIGNQQSGAITVSSDVSLHNVDTISLTTGSSVTGTAGGIAVNQLAIAAAGDINFTATSTNISRVAMQSSSGSVDFHNNANLIVGTVAGKSGIDTTGGSGHLTLQSAGTISLEQALNAGTGIVRITAAGGISQSSIGSITASGLGVINTGTGNIVLTSGNAVSTLAADNSAAGGTIRFVDASDVTIGSISTEGPLFSGATGVTSNNGDFSLQSARSVTVDKSVSAGTGTVRVDAAGGISQDSAGAITARNLGLINTSHGDINLNALNDVQTVAIANDTTGGILFQNSVALEIGSVIADGSLFQGAIGVTSGDANLVGGNITVKSADTLTVDQVITSVGGTGGTIAAEGAILNAAVTAGAGSVNLNGGGPDMIVNVTESSATSLSLTATRDLLINASVTANNNLTLVSGRNSSIVAPITATLGSISSNAQGTFTSSATITAGTDVMVTSRGSLAVSTPVIAGHDTSLTSTAANIDVTSTINATNNVSLNALTTIDVTATLDAGHGISMTSGGSTTLESTSALTTGAGGIQVNVGQLNDGADLSTSSGAISLTGPVVLKNDVSWSTTASGTGNKIAVNGSIDAANSGVDSLSLTAGTGNIDVTGNVGGNSSLGKLLINQANDTTFGRSVSAASFQQIAGTSTMFEGAVTTSNVVPTSGTVGFEFTGHSLQFTAGTSSLDSQGHEILITSDAVTLPTTFVNAIGKTVTIQTLSRSTTIGLEDATQDLNFTNSQLNVIHSQNIVIGQTGNTGGIKIATDGTVIGNANITLLTAAGLEISGLFQLTGGNSLTGTIGGNLLIASGGTVQTDSGNVDFQLGGDGTQSGVIETNSGNTTIDVAGQYSMTSTGLVQSHSGNVTITTGIAQTSSHDSLNMSSGAVINAGSGAIDLTAYGDVTLGRVETSNDSSNAIQITSRIGAIVNGNLPGLMNIVDDSARSGVTLTAVTGIGSANGSPLQTNLVNLTVINAPNSGISASGDIRIDDLNRAGFAIRQIDQTGLGVVDVTSQGTIVLTDPTAGGQGIHSTTGSITLDAMNSQSNLDLRSPIQTAGGQVLLEADNGIILGLAGQGSTGKIQSSGGNISLLADHRGGTLGQVFMRDGSAVNAGTGTILIDAWGDITLGHLFTSNNSTSAVELISRGGGLINGGNSGGFNIDANANGALTTIQTNSGIGSQSAFVVNPEIETRISELNLINGPHGGSIVTPGSNNINLNNSGALIIPQLTQNQPGWIHITTGGQLDVLSTGSGVTATSGAINLTATGSNGIVDLVGGISTTGGGVTVDSDQNLLMSGVSSVNSQGGDITFFAGAGNTFSNGQGGITMANGATVKGGGGSIHFTAQQDIQLAQIVSNSNPATAVTLISRRGGIESGAQPGLNDISAGTLVLQSITGIGTVQPLQISTSSLAAYNNGSGNIQLINHSGALLTIGSGAGVTGVTNVGPATGDIIITNNAAMLIAAPIINSSGGNIGLTTIGAMADVSIKSQIIASGGDGNIALQAGNNIHIENVGASPQIETQGNGFIVLNAQGQVNFDSKVLVQSGTGSIVDAPPKLINVLTPEIAASGLSYVTGDFGRPGEHNFLITVNWSDGKIQTFHFQDPGHFSFDHIYHSNPNKDQPSQPIPITVTVTQDSHIIVNALTGNRDSTTTTSYAQVPGSGLIVFAFDTTPYVVLLTLPEPQKFFDVIHQSGVQIADNSTIRLDTVRFDSAVPGERRIIFEVLSPDGKVLQQVEMPETVLDEMLDVIARLPDGKYRFQLQEPGEERQRLLLEFQVRQGKIVDESDRTSRPPSSSNMKDPGPDTSGSNSAPDTDKPNPAPPPTDNSSSIAPAGLIPVSLRESLDSRTASGHNEAANSELPSSGWGSIAVRRAWKRAEEVVAHQFRMIEHPGDDHSESDAALSMDDSSVEPSHSSVMLVSAATLFTQTSLSGKRDRRPKPAARLSRAARMFRKLGGGRNPSQDNG